MTWKVSALFFFISCVLLFAVVLLWQQTTILKSQNCTLQKALEVNIETAKKKAERDKKELERLSRELAVMAEADPAWSDSPLPSTIASQLHRVIKDHNSTLSALARTEDNLQK